MNRVNETGQFNTLNIFKLMNKKVTHLLPEISFIWTHGLEKPIAVSVNSWSFAFEANIHVRALG